MKIKSPLSCFKQSRVAGDDGVSLSPPGRRTSRGAGLDELRGRPQLSADAGTQELGRSAPRSTLQKLRAAMTKPFSKCLGGGAAASAPVPASVPEQASTIAPRPRGRTVRELMQDENVASDVSTRAGGRQQRRAGPPTHGFQQQRAPHVVIDIPDDIPELIRRQPHAPTHDLREQHAPHVVIDIPDDIPDPIRRQPRASTHGMREQRAPHVVIDIPDSIRPSPEQNSVPDEPTRFRISTGATYAEPLVDAVAASLSLASSRLPGGSVAAKATALTSGVMWASAGIAGEFGNALHSKVATGANVLTIAAGALSAVAPFKSPMQTGYASAAGWAASGAARILHATSDSTRSSVSRLLEGASGAAALAAAGLSAAATNASSNNDGVEAARLALTSSVVWMGAAVVGLGAAVTARPVAVQSEPGSVSGQS